MAKKQQTALEFAVKMVSMRDYGEQELRQRMQTKGFEPAAIDEAIGQLRSKRYLDDEAFIKKTIEKYTIKQPSGRAFIKEMLEQKGIKPDAYEPLLEGRDERAAAVAAFKLREPKPVPPERAIKTRQKTGNYLASKGFDYDIIEDVLNEYIKGGSELE